MPFNFYALLMFVFPLYYLLNAKGRYISLLMCGAMSFFYAYTLSILTFKISPKAFVMVLWVLFFVPLIIIINLNLWIDPYFIFRKSPFEPRFMSIDHHQMFAKSPYCKNHFPHRILYKLYCSPTE